MVERWMYLNQERLLKYMPGFTLPEAAGPSQLIKVYEMVRGAKDRNERLSTALHAWVM